MKKYLFIILILIAFVCDTKAQVREFKLLYGKKELLIHNDDTLDSKIFENDSVSIKPHLENTMNKYSFEGGKIMIKTIGKKVNNSNDTVYYFDSFLPVLSNNIQNILKSRKATEITIFTDLKTIIANYKEVKKEYILFFYLK